MNEWVIIERGNGKYPPIIFVSDALIGGTNEQINSALPDTLKMPGAIIFNADETQKKRLNFDGEWVSFTGTVAR